MRPHVEEDDRGLGVGQEMRSELGRLESMRNKDYVDDALKALDHRRDSQESSKRWTKLRCYH